MVLSHIYIMEFKLSHIYIINFFYYKKKKKNILIEQILFHNILSSI